MLSYLSLLLILFSVSLTPAIAVKKSYIVYLGEHSHGPGVTSADLNRVVDSHHKFLGSFLGSTEKAKDAIFYSYKRHINGFAAMLEDDQVGEIQRHPSVISVFLNKARKLHTTRSWEFMMLEKNGGVHPSSLWKKARFGEDIIIANLDTGVWPESKSFSDEGFGPIPSRWKGICQNDNTTAGFSCNKKLIGARYFNKGYIASGVNVTASMQTARDYDGHGSHTLSTAAGNIVHGASVLGVVNGTAKGGSPKARVAAYKVCWPPVDGSECMDADLLQGFDTAIHDGVDVISVSLGGSSSDYLDDGLAIGSFHAVKNGVVVVASAGNDGPDPGTVTNVAPWIITVAASTLDRSLQNSAKLQNGLVLKGASLSKPTMPKEKFYPLISAAQAKKANASVDDAIKCKKGTLDPKKTKGKILACLRGETALIEKGHQAALAGAVGMILCNNKTNGNEIFTVSHILPAIHVNYRDGVRVFDYISSSKDPRAYITAPETVLHTKPAPFMASFSSVGPNTVTPQILKPDITAPGVDIIAAYSEAANPTEEDYDKRNSPFNMISGTSMSCPHVAGVVGLLKSLHPNWSPAAIRSSIMTTARTRDNTINPMRDGTEKDKATQFNYGAGHMRPNRAMDPGLVYDLNVNDYLDFLCTLGYNQKNITKFSGTISPYHCHKKHHGHTNLLDFNNPAITIPNISHSGPVTVTRRLKNVGPPGLYNVHVRLPRRMFSVSVEPSVLKFDHVGQEKSFKLTIEVTDAKAVKHGYVFGELLWTDRVHYVRSPIAVSSVSSHKN
ncbi:subtilisin-like protease SBT5.4 [Lycium ferocissimum]|uniref:subtilisin-like protease SBT5.4 n=1 Tax=Lycium ferocissimum TaxID=112874 RepID=UPI00281542A5|nr:subtilisin-like protease SBT5.4 [Lycium ferocissimum]